jgi:hypothetical protein
MTSVTKATAADVARSDRRFLGHPIGLAYLSFAEAWERFSYYGMLGLLTLYPTTQLLLPGHVDNVVGMAGLRGVLESLRGFSPPATWPAFSVAISRTCRRASSGACTPRSSGSPASSSSSSVNGSATCWVPETRRRPDCQTSARREQHGA